MFCTKTKVAKGEAHLRDTMVETKYFSGFDSSFKFRSTGVVDCSSKKASIVSDGSDTQHLTKRYSPVGFFIFKKFFCYFPIDFLPFLSVIHLS